MVTLIKRGETTVSPILELCGLSTDTKPTEYNGDKVSNGSTFYEMDTKNVYIYDAENSSWLSV